MVHPVLMGAAVGGLAAALLSDRKVPRSEWLSMFERWVNPASAAEETRIVNTEAAIKRAIEARYGSKSNGIKFVRQGSSVNNTNTKNKSDLDLVIIAEFEEWFDPDTNGNFPAMFTPGGKQIADVYPQFRREILDALSGFNLLTYVEEGRKAIKLTPLTDARVECDIVPAFRLKKYRPIANALNVPQTDDGIIFLSDSGHSIRSFPEQHLVNGKSKNTLTNHRYKQIVRIFKKMRNRFDNAATLLTSTELPSSYLIECLIYNVPSKRLTEGDLYDAVLSSAVWIKESLASGPRCNQLEQVNGIYSVFPHWGASLLTSLSKSDEVDMCERFVSRIMSDIKPQ